METNQRIRQIIKSQTAPYPPQGVLWVHELDGKEVKEVWKNGQWAPVETISLEEIWDVLNNGGGAPKPLEIIMPEEDVSGTKAEVATALGITEQDLDDILEGKVITIKLIHEEEGSPLEARIIPLTRVTIMDGNANAQYNVTSSRSVEIEKDEDEYMFSFTSEGSGGSEGGIIGG